MLESLPVQTPAYPDGLTQREAEVLQLFCGDKTDWEMEKSSSSASRPWATTWATSSTRPERSAGQKLPATIISTT